MMPKMMGMMGGGEGEGGMMGMIPTLRRMETPPQAFTFSIILEDNN
ncbi:MAG: hypothetical protein KAV87_45375 [Desulfobacteraceae bacterium]|nr:hypothetical protein [Desulfobacteraceae bacterium]